LGVAFVDKTTAMEGRGGVLSVSIGHCFPYGYVAELSGRIRVATDGDKAQADRLAIAIGQAFIGTRGRTAPNYLLAEDAITATLDCIKKIIYSVRLWWPNRPITPVAERRAIIQRYCGC
jgi:microcystin degradation protein MlrC